MDSEKYHRRATGYGNDVSLLVDSPALIEDDIFNAMLLGEVDVVLVGGGGRRGS